jgi:hypothetical protein
MAVTVDWKRGFIDVDHVAFSDVLFDLLIRGSQLVCDPLGEVIDGPMGDWLIELPLKEVSLFSVGKAAVEASECGLGQNIRPKPPDSRTLFVGGSDFVPTRAVVSAKFVLGDGNRNWKRCIDDCLGSVAVRISEKRLTVWAACLVNPDSLIRIRRWTSCAF